MTAEEEVARRLLDARAEGDVDYLIESLRDPEWRTLSARFLGELQDARAVEPLARLLDASDSGVRGSAAKALSRLPAEPAADRLHEVAERDEDEIVRRWAVHALAEIGDTRAVPFLLQEVARGSSRECEWALSHLERLGDPGAIEPLRAALESAGWPRRRRLAQALRKIESHRADVLG